MELIVWPKLCPPPFSRLKVEMNLCCAVTVRQNSTSTLSHKGGGRPIHESSDFGHDLMPRLSLKFLDLVFFSVKNDTVLT